MRCLADLAFMLGQYDFAVAMYRLAAQDYLAAPNSKWYAGAEVCSMLLESGSSLYHNCWHVQTGSTDSHVSCILFFFLSYNVQMQLHTTQMLACAHDQLQHNSVAGLMLMEGCCCASGNDRLVLHPDTRSLCRPCQVPEPRIRALQQAARQQAGPYAGYARDDDSSSVPSSARQVRRNLVMKLRELQPCAPSNVRSVHET